MGICSVTNCDKPTKRNTFCYGHYMKNWRYGTPTPDWPAKWVDERGNRYGSLVVHERSGHQWICLCDCGETRKVSAGELHRTGESNTCGQPGQHLAPVSRYSTAHSRVSSDRGAARQHKCIDCGRQAKHWSYNHDDPNELHEAGLSAQPIAFGTHPDHYSARCVPCHKRFDLGRADSAMQG